MLATSSSLYQPQPRRRMLYLPGVRARVASQGRSGHGGYAGSVPYAKLRPAEMESGQAAARLGGRGSSSWRRRRRSRVPKEGGGGRVRLRLSRLRLARWLSPLWLLNKVRLIYASMLLDPHGHAPVLMMGLHFTHPSI